MRLVLLLLFTLPIQSQTTSIQTTRPSALSVPDAPVDPEKLAIIKDIAAAQNLKVSTSQVLDRSVMPLLRSMQANPKTPTGMVGELQEIVKKREQEVDVVALIAPAYAANYSAAELRELLQFYLSPIGQKFAEHNPVVERQVSNRQFEIGRQLGMDAWTEVMQAHPEYAAQLNQARPADGATPPVSLPGEQGFVGQAFVPPPGSVRIGEQVADANLLNKVAPVYPPLAKSARLSGTVLFSALISKEGHVQQLQLVHGHPLLVNAAREAVLQWTYRPTLLNGSAVEVITMITVNFTLSE